MTEDDDRAYYFSRLADRRTEERNGLLEILWQLKAHLPPEVYRQAEESYDRRVKAIARRYK